MVLAVAGGTYRACRRRSVHRLEPARQATALRRPRPMAFAGLVPDPEGEPLLLHPCVAAPIRFLLRPGPRRARTRSPRAPASAPARSGPAGSNASAAAAGRRWPHQVHRAQARAELPVRADRAVVTEREVLLQFDVMLTNIRAAPARDVLVEAQLVTGPCRPGPGNRRLLPAIRRQAATGWPAIAPLGTDLPEERGPPAARSVAQLRGRRPQAVRAAGRVQHPLSRQRRRGPGSASFLVGRGNDEDEKLAPFRLDLGPRIFRGLSARPHSMGC